ncbi:MAG: DUF4166 domain-containing protein [Armatimonas sp.]
MLYRQVLGESFDTLHPHLRRFHGAHTAIVGHGSFTVERRRGTALLAALLRLPRAGEKVTVQIEVQPTPTGEKWIRRFEKSPMITEQWHQGTLLHEKAGPMTFGLEITVNREGGVDFTTRRGWFLGIPLPLSLSPKVTAHTKPTESGWHAQVELTLPLLGWLLRYEGEVIPQWT